MVKEIPSTYVFKIASGNFNNDWHRFADLTALGVERIGTFKKTGKQAYGVKLSADNIAQFFIDAAAITEKGIVVKKGKSINSIDWTIDTKNVVQMPPEFEGFPPDYLELLLFDI